MKDISKTEFLKLVDAYFGAKDHERWTAVNGTPEQHARAVAAVAEALKALREAS